MCSNSKRACGRSIFLPIFLSRLKRHHKPRHLPTQESRGNLPSSVLSKNQSKHLHAPPFVVKSTEAFRITTAMIRERQCKSCDSPADRHAKVCEVLLPPKLAAACGSIDLTPCSSLIQICGEDISDSLPPLQPHRGVRSRIFAYPSLIKPAAYTRVGGFDDPEYVSRSQNSPRDYIVSHPRPIKAALYTHGGAGLHDPGVVFRSHRSAQGYESTCRPREAVCGSCDSVNDGTARICHVSFAVPRNANAQPKSRICIAALPSLMSHVVSFCHGTFISASDSNYFDCSTHSQAWRAQICGERMRTEEAHLRKQAVAFERAVKYVPDPFDREKVKPLVWSEGKFEFKGPDGSRKTLVVPVLQKPEDGGWL